MFLTPPNKSKALHYLCLDSGVLRAFRVAATTAQSAFASWVERRLFRRPAVDLISRCIGLGAIGTESKPMEDVMRLIKPQGRRELFKAPSMKTGKPPVVRWLSGAACCQAAIRCCSCHGYFRVLLVDQQPRLLLCIFGICRAPIEDCGVIRSALSGRLPICSAFVPEV